jgi:hypothetical protein
VHGVGRCVEEFWKSIRANTGNTKSYPKKYGGLAPNGVILRYVCLEGKKFWIRFATPKTPEDFAVGPPDDGNDVVYSNRYVLLGLRNALGEDKTKNNKNMQRQWRPDTRHRVVQVSKVYSFPLDDDRQSELFDGKRINKKTPEGSTPGSTWSLCVVQDATVDQKYETLVSKHETLKLENRALKLENNNLKSLSHKSDNQALKLRNDSLKSDAVTLERQNKSFLAMIRNAKMNANDNNNDVSSDLPSDASDAAWSFFDHTTVITTDKIWERIFQPGGTSINNELIVCAVFKTILQSAEKIYIYPIVG